MDFLFYISVFMVFFAYFGYPLTLAIIGKFVSFTPKRERIEPSVTLIITAYNEERRIRKKLENTIKIDYPRDKFQVIVASDGSTDKTNDIVRDFADRKIELLDVKDRKGKENAQKEAIKIARGEIIVFSDVATILDPSGIREIVSNFADPAIGCVSSEDRMIEDSSGSGGGGEGFYVKYEMWLRGLESRIHSVVGLSGSFFAARREVCEDFSPKMQSDFRTLLSSMRKGMRGISDPHAVGYYQDIKDTSREFDRKVRTVIRGLNVFFHNFEFVNVFEFGIFSYQYICHKLLRWLVPFFMLSALVSNVFLAFHSVWFAAFFALQIVFYSAAVAGIAGVGRRSSFVGVKIPKFFVLVNTSILIAWIRYLRGERLTMWTPSVR